MVENNLEKNDFYKRSRYSIRWNISGYTNTQRSTNQQLLRVIAEILCKLKMTKKIAMPKSAMEDQQEVSM